MIETAIAIVGGAFVSLLVNAISMSASNDMASNQFEASKQLAQEQQATSEAFSKEFAEKQRLQSLEDYAAQYAQQKRDAEIAQYRYESRRRSRQVGTGFSKRV